MRSFLELLRPWILPAVAIIAVVLLVVAWNRNRSISDRAAREREAAELEKAGIIAAHEHSKKELLAEMALMARESKALRSELARVQAAAPGARPVATVAGTTGPQRVNGQGAVTTAPTATPPASGGACAPTPCPLVPGCHLADGEGLEIRVRGVALETRNGNLVAVGIAQAIAHHTDGNEWPIMEAPLKLEVGTLPRQEPPGWGAGLALVGGRDGWWVGPILSSPAVSVLGLDLAVLLGGGAGPSGSWGGLAGAILRW